MMRVGEGRGMTLIVKTVTRITLGFILIYGVYVTFNGHVAPGGGFAGGVIVALSFVHIMLAFGKEVALRRLHSYVLRTAVSVGALLFLYTVVIGSSLRPLSAFRSFENDMMMPFCEMIIVGFGLFAIFTALVLLSKTDKDAE